jgi:hypothetical protein
MAGLYGRRIRGSEGRRGDWPQENVRHRDDSWEWWQNLVVEKRQNVLSLAGFQLDGFDGQNMIIVPY